MIRTARIAILLALLAPACSDPPPSAPPPDATPAPAAASSGAKLDFTEAELSVAVPFVPTPMPVVERMLQMAGVDETDLVYDLGSGDGRIVITAAKDFGARGVGVEIEPALVAEARDLAKQAGVESRVTFLQEDLFHTDLRPATVLTLYLLNSVNLELRPKILAELRPGTPVVSHDFSMGDWRADRHVSMGSSDIYLWVVPARVQGRWRWTGPEGSQHQAELRQNFQKIDGRADGTAMLEPTLLGPEISFTASGSRYEGTVENNTIRGTVTTGDQSASWVATKVGG